MFLKNVVAYQTTRHHIPKEIFQSHRRRNVKFRMVLSFNSINIYAIRFTKYYP